MTHVGYLIAGYTITFGAIGAYAAWICARSRALARSHQVQGPSDPRRQTALDGPHRAP